MCVYSTRASVYNMSYYHSVKLSVCVSFSLCMQLDGDGPSDGQDSDPYKAQTACTPVSDM